MKFNISKYKILHSGRTNRNYKYVMDKHIVQSMKDEQDLRIAEVCAGSLRFNTWERQPKFRLTSFMRSVNEYNYYYQSLRLKPPFFMSCRSSYKPSIGVKWVR